MERLNHTDGEVLSGEEGMEIPPEKVGFFELCYGILFQPARTFRLMKFSPPLFYSLIVLLTTNLLSSLVNYLTGVPVRIEDMPPDFPRQLMPLFDALQTPGFGIAAAFFGIILAIVFWVLNGGLMQIIAEFLGGKGKGVDTLVVTGISVLPMLFLIPVQVIFSIAGLPATFSMIVSVPLAIWSYLILPIIGLKAMHEFGTGRSLATVLAPLALFIVLMLTFMFMIIIAMMPIMVNF